MVALNALIVACAISGTNQTVLLDFYSPTCGPCQQMEPTIKRLQAEGFPVHKVDVTRNRKLAVRYRVETVPCFILLAEQQVVGRIDGGTNYSQLRRMFDKAGFTRVAKNDRVRQQSPDSSARRSVTTQSSSIQPSSIQPPPARQPPPPLIAKTGAPTDTKAVSFVSTHQKSIDPAAIQRRAMQATVRLKVEDPKGFSFGTGTIIDVHGEEALVLTCGHIFRDSKGSGPITVDLVAPGARGPVKGTLIAHDYEKRDIALVAIRPGVKIEPIQVAPGGYRPAKGDRVFAIGCDNGGEARLMNSQITGLNRYHGPANIEATGLPVDGRSGGGLFSNDGYLIGVCNLADPTDNEGIYAALEVVHEQLVQIRHEHIFRRAETFIAANEKRAAPLRKLRPSPRSDLAKLPSMPKTMPRQNGFDFANKSSPADNSFGRLEATEIICIVRTKDNPQGRIVVLDRPSPELLERIRIASRSQGPLSGRPGTNPAGKRRSSIAGSTEPRRGLGDPRRDSSRVIRAQSAD